MHSKMRCPSADCTTFVRTQQWPSSYHFERSRLTPNSQLWRMRAVSEGPSADYIFQPCLTTCEDLKCRRDASDQAIQIRSYWAVVSFLAECMVLRAKKLFSARNNSRPLKSQQSVHLSVPWEERGQVWAFHFVCGYKSDVKLISRGCGRLMIYIFLSDPSVIVYWHSSQCGHSGNLTTSQRPTRLWFTVVLCSWTDMHSLMSFRTVTDSSVYFKAVSKHG